MPKQKVPDIDFEYFVVSEIRNLFDQKKIYINESYQRGDIWRHKQQTELIKSIENRYSIGVLVLYINDNGQYEILDGQQRLLAIKKYLEDTLDLTDTDIQKYSDLNTRDKALLDAYCVYYIKLKSHDAESKEEDIVQTFIRLQEGTPLNKAEKINAHRGVFKNIFRKTRDEHSLFALLGKEKRFRWRQLAAELLLLELEGDFDNLVFPGLDLETLIIAIKKYENKISDKKIKFFTGVLDLMHSSLNILLTACSPREIISFYLLLSYLRKKKADNSNLINEFAEFSREFLKNLHSFSIYDLKPPKGMKSGLFNSYKIYKQEAKVMTTPDSIKKRFGIVLSEYKRLKPFIMKDKKRLHDAEEKRTLYFRQKGLCAVCNKEMHFEFSSSHHVIPHSKGGKTDDLDHAMLVHERCHRRLEKKKK